MTATRPPLLDMLTTLPRAFLTMGSIWSKLNRHATQLQTDEGLLVPGGLAVLHCEDVLFTSQTIPTC